MSKGRATILDQGTERQKARPNVAPETFTYLLDLIKQRPADTLAEALDLLVERLRAQENREWLERATPQPTTSPGQEEGESILAAALSKSALGIEFDREP